MAETFSRSLLEVDRLYYSIPDEQWFSTPDGVGVHFYGSRAEALEETGFDEKLTRFINQPLSDH